MIEDIYVDPEELARIQTDPLQTPIPGGRQVSKAVDLVTKLLVWAVYGNVHDAAMEASITPSNHQWLFHPDWLLTRPDMMYYGVSKDSPDWKRIQESGGRAPDNPCVSAYPDPPSSQPGWHQLANGMWQRTDNPEAVCLAICSTDIMVCVSSSETGVGGNKRWTTEMIANCRTVGDFVKVVESFLPKE